MSNLQPLILAAIEFGATRNEIQARQRECLAADVVVADAYKVVHIADVRHDFSGSADDYAALLAASKKAQLAERYAAAIRDKVTEAYRAHSDAAEKLAYEIGRAKS